MTQDSWASAGSKLSPERTEPRDLQQIAGKNATSFSAPRCKARNGKISGMACTGLFLGLITSRLATADCPAGSLRVHQEQGMAWAMYTYTWTFLQDGNTEGMAQGNLQQILRPPFQGPEMHKRIYHCVTGSIPGFDSRSVGFNN